MTDGAQDVQVPALPACRRTRSQVANTASMVSGAAFPARKKPPELREDMRKGFTVSDMSERSNLAVLHRRARVPLCWQAQAVKGKEKLITQQALDDFMGVLELSLQSPECTDVIP